jgi:hypothetical protein
MGTYTAQVLIGTPHPNHGGIHPTHQLMLSENSRPAWILTSWENTEEEKVWIPTIESMLEDGLLMIAFYLLKEREDNVLFRDFARKIKPKKSLY